MVQLRIFVNFRNALKPFTDAEKGRLFDAMLAYADDKTVLPLSGNERFIWDLVKETLDAQHNAYEHQCAVNKKNRGNESSRIVTNRHESSQDNLSLSNFEVQDQVQVQVQEKKNYSQEKKPRKREFDQRSVTNDDFKDLFINLDELEKKYIEEGKI